ncbi:UNVERIFIED_CONTAM: hypothetical protein NCL1_16351 [Trichonephila clavipes]
MKFAEHLGLLRSFFLLFCNGTRSLIVWVTNSGVAEWSRYPIVAGLVVSSSPVPLKTRRVGQRCTLNLSRAQTSFRWCVLVVRRGGCRPRHLVQNDVAKRPRVAEQCDVNTHSRTRGRR